jgi:hypothetical protein
MRTRLSTPQTEVVSLLVPLFPLLLLRSSLFLEGFPGLLSRRFLRGSVWHRILQSFGVAFWSVGASSQGTEDRVQSYCGYPDRRIAHSIGDDQAAVMNERTAGVDDIRHITVLLVRNWTE